MVDHWVEQTRVAAGTRMRWLITMAGDVEPSERARVLRALDAFCDDPESIVPVGDTCVIEVEGPDDLPDRSRSQPKILSVHPSSDITLY